MRRTVAPVVVVLATVATVAAGAPFADAPRSQHFRDFGPCPLAPANRYLPSAAGCVTARRADVDGDGRADLVLLWAKLDGRRLPSAHTLEIVRASRATVAAHTRRFALDGAKILRIADVNARAGAEIFVHEAHITTEELAGVYTFDGHALQRSGEFSYDGTEAGIRSGFTCHGGRRPTIVQHFFSEPSPLRGVWTRTDTTYRWKAGQLRRVKLRKARVKPSAAQVGVHC